MGKNDYIINNMISSSYDVSSLKEVYGKALESRASLANMGEVVFSTSEKPIVGTTGLATCWGVIFYDRKNRKAYVCHAPASHYFQTLNQMISILDKNADVIEYKIVPGCMLLEKVFL